MSNASPLRREGLSQRQLNMIAIGGVVGAGLFVGSGVVIRETGPAAFVSYAIAGVLIVLVMRMLGEMATANPSTGAFADYARQALGNWAGFSVGWLYWYFWVVVVGFEAVAGGTVIRYWLDAPLWLLSLILMVAMTAINLVSVTSFGEFEFWFAGIKVATVLVFLCLGGLFVLGLWPGHGPDFHNLTSHGGFLPHGAGTVVGAVAVVVSAMVGAEVATIAAAETADPQRAIQRATNTVVVRILIFFVGSAFLLAVILPWHSPELGVSPFAGALSVIGVPGAGHIVNVVVLTAVLSCLNSGLYTASRMLFVLAARREAPARLVTVGRRGVPYVAILFSSVVGFLCVAMAWVAPGVVFAFLLKSSGAVVLFVYLLIALSQIVLRRRTSGDQLRVRMWFFPVLSILTLAGIVAVLVRMAFDDGERTQLWLSVVAWAVVTALYFVGKWWRGLARPEAEVAVTGTAARVLVLANQTLAAAALFNELDRLDGAHAAEYFICVPTSPVDTGQAENTGPLYLRDATAQAAQQRLDDMVTALRTIGVHADGMLGDERPMHALAAAMRRFRPDHLVIAGARTSWPWFDLASRARSAYAIPVIHVLTGAREAVKDRGIQRRPYVAQPVSSLR